MAHPIDAEQVFLRTQNLLGFSAESAVVLYSRGFDTPLVPKQLGDLLKLWVLFPNLNLQTTSDAPCEIRVGAEAHMFNDSGENFIDGEDFVRVLHAFQLGHRRRKKRITYV